MNSKDVRTVENIVFAAIQDLDAAKAKLGLVGRETDECPIYVIEGITDIIGIKLRLRAGVSQNG